MQDDPKPLLVGWREWVSLPALGVPAVKAKIDTGARTSAMHATEIERYTDERGRDRVRFSVHPLQHTAKKARPDVVVRCDAALVDARVVTPSSGHREHRLVIETAIKLGALAWSIEITLTDRADMRFRMLLGRQALKQQPLLVDAGRSYLAGKRGKGQTKPRPSDPPDHSR